MDFFERMFKPRPYTVIKQRSKAKKDCVICLEKLNGSVVRLPCRCMLLIHRKCIDDNIDAGNLNCPICADNIYEWENCYRSIGSNKKRRNPLHRPFGKKVIKYKFTNNISFN